MADAEFQAWWPDLGAVAAELRRIDQPAVADLLADAVRAGATSGEIIDGVAVVLRDHHELRCRLSAVGMAAWDAVMADVYRAYPGSRFSHWLARMTNRIGLFAALTKRRK